MMRPFFCILAIVVALPVSAEVALHGLFTDNMVIQRDTDAPIWGTADPGEKITISTSWGESARTRTNKKGAWKTKLDTPAAGGPHTITVSGNNTITLRNVLSGDVWVCGGQSNMDFDLGAFANAQRQPAEVVARTNRIINGKFDIRTIVLKKEHRALPQKHIVVEDVFNNSWQPMNTPEINSAASTVAFYFGRQLQKELGVPIGLLDSNRGGSAVEQWMDAETAGIAKIPEETNGTTDRKAHTALYNGMTAPLIPFAIKGAIWYQGESNAKSIETSMAYAKKFSDMITCWRSNWGQGKFPFLFVQLAAFRDAQQEPVPAADTWPYLRESQSKTLSLRNTGMASAIDVGMQKNIHPHQKDVVGQRLAAAALEVAYDQELVYTGPTFDEMEVEGNKAIIEFDHVGGGLTAKAVNLDGIEVSADEIKGFVICGEDQVFHYANAEIDGDEVIVSCPAVKKPVAVRYAWANFPICNLYNAEGFPANPFRTDTFAPAE